MNMELLVYMSKGFARFNFMFPFLSVLGKDNFILSTCIVFSLGLITVVGSDKRMVLTRPRKLRSAVCVCVL